MKSSVNLYQDSLRPKPQSVTLNHVAVTTGIVGVVIAILIGFVGMQANRLSNQQQQLALELQAATDELAVFQKTLAERKPDQQLETSLSQIKLSNGQKQSLLQYLQAENQRPAPDYVRAFKHLEQVDQQGLWLTKFSFAGHELQFQGMTQDAKLVADWLQQLGQDPFFRGQSFQTISVKPAERGTLRFEVLAKPLAKEPQS
jgi:Tfp pilus assembly protein PilN